MNRDKLNKLTIINEMNRNIGDLGMGKGMDRAGNNYGIIWFLHKTKIPGNRFTCASLHFWVYQPFLSCWNPCPFCYWTFFGHVYDLV